MRIGSFFARKNHAARRPFFPETNDQIRADKRIEAAITKAGDMGLLHKLSTSESDERYEVRRIVKARFSYRT